VCGENFLAGAWAVRQGLGAMLENVKICGKPDQIEERVRLGGGGAWGFIEEGMGVGGLRAAVAEGKFRWRNPSACLIIS
jgi:hypothetical protein